MSKVKQSDIAKILGVDEARVTQLKAKEIAVIASDVIQAIDSELPLPAPGAAWVRQGMTAILSGHDVRAALQLKKAHGKRAERGVQKALRDERIRTLAACFDPENRDPTATSERAAEVLSGSMDAPAGMEDSVTSIRQAGSIGARQILRIISTGKPEHAQPATLNNLLCLWTNGR